MSNKTYDFLKKLVELILPASATFYFTMSTIWGFPNAEQVVASIAALATFLGVCLHISSKRYSDRELNFDGSIVVESDEDKMLYTLELNDMAESLATKDSVLFKIKRDDAI